MIKILFPVLAAILLFSGCSVTSEKYRYQHRFDKFYNLLSQEEKTNFAENELDNLGSSMDKRAASDARFAKLLAQVHTDEAINTFDGKETAEFFRKIILRELNRNNYYAFMSFMDAKAQAAFSAKKGSSEILNALYNTDRKFAGFMDSLKSEYRLYLFSNEGIYRFFREISFPELTRKEFYPVLKLLKESKALQEFKTGDTAGAARKLDLTITKMISKEYDFTAIKKRAGLTRLGSSDFLNVFYNFVMKEMDRGAAARTLEKF